MFFVVVWYYNISTKLLGCKTWIYLLGRKNSVVLNFYPTVVGSLFCNAVIILILGPDPDRLIQDNSGILYAVLEEQKHKKQSQPVPISGPDLAAMMKISTRVVRGVDWKWGDQVGQYVYYSNILIYT